MMSAGTTPTGVTASAVSPARMFRDRHLAAAELADGCHELDAPDTEPDLT
jgi:hypothetical protein